jgi:hypothetical protein
MDEELLEVATEETIEVTGTEITKTEVTIEDEEYDITTEEIVETIEVNSAETIEIEIDEATGWVGGDSDRHYSLLGRNDPNQHEIKAITGLREELDEIERLKTIYSDKYNVANYYEWDDASYDTYGYFVSLVSGTSKIRICDGDNILGVSVDAAGFIGGQDKDVPRDVSYGLIVTSGIVDVRCELDVKVGDYVISNARGYAKKAQSNYGYKVLAKANKNGVEYAVITLGVQADVTDALGNSLDLIAKRVDVNEQNIVSAINVSNQAYNKSLEAAESSSASRKNIEEALTEILGFGDKLEDMEKTVASANIISEQAKAIADGAVVSAESMRNEAVEKANEAWKGIDDLTETLKPITEWKDPDNEENTGAQYFTEYMTEGLNTKVDIETFETKTEEGFNAIKRNARETQSLITVIDKYSVGEYSQANGLTLEQAHSILEIGMIYVPTSHENMDAGTQHHKEEYTYTVDGETKKYTRWFTPGYLYRWDEIPNEEIGIGWKTIGNNGEDTTEEDYTDESSMIAPTTSEWVFFATNEPIISSEWDYGYWFTNGDIITDVNGSTDTYVPYTLYKLEKSDDGDYWFAVATLQGNVNNRATSQIRQMTNEITAEITNGRGSVAGFGVWIQDTESAVQQLSVWQEEEEKNMATVKTIANEDGASVVISALQKNEETIDEMASLVLNVDKDKSTLVIDADHINFESDNYTVKSDHIVFTDSTDYSVLSKNITFAADQINFSVGDFGGENLLLGSGVEYTKTSSAILHTYSLTEQLVKGKTYTVSMSITPGSDVEHICLYMLGGVNWNAGISRITPNGTDKQELTQTFIIGDDVESLGAMKINLNTYASDYKAPTTTSTVHWIKLEHGRVATSWSPASEDKVSTEQTSSAMKWKLLPEKCVWWNNIGGTNSESAPLMKLDSTGLYISGEVHAQTGEIGGFTINNDTIKTNDFGFKDGVFLSSVNMPGKSGFFDGTSISDWRMTIGSKFGVTSSGKLYATEAQITGIITATAGGTIGGWNIGANYLTNGKIGQNKSFHMYTSDSSSAATVAEVSSKSWRLTIGSNFGVESSGKLYASDAKITGGSIGSWRISGTKLISVDEEDSGYGIGLNCNPDYFNGSDTYNIFAIGQIGLDKDGNYLTGFSNWSNAAFRVKSDGTLIASKAEIEGVIKAKAGGTLSCWTIKGDCLEAESSYNSVYEKIQLSPIGIKLWVKTGSNTFAKEPTRWATWNNLIWRVQSLWGTAVIDNDNPRDSAFAKWW